MHERETDMIKDIVKDPFFLGQKSTDATKADIQTANDLIDTLRHNRDICVGMAANMIGVKKRIIVFDNGGMIFVMFNPEIIEKSGEYETEESCLSLSGSRPTKRYEKITVRYQNNRFKELTGTFTGWTAQIIQHEIDHCNGILI